MTIQEMHIGIDLYLQKVNSSYVDSLLPEEKDWFINSEQLRFINNRINAYSNDKRQGLQFNQKRYDDLEKLISHFDTIALIKEQGVSKYINLPPNYLYLLNDRSSVNKNCPATIIESNLTGETFYVPFSISHLDIEDLNDFEIIYQGNTIFATAAYPNLVINSPEEQFTLINLILYHLELNGYECYYENYGDIYKPNQFIMIVDDSETITIQGNDSGDDLEFDYDSFEFDYVNYIPSFQVPNRLTKTEDLYEILRGAFTDSIRESPVSTMSNGQLVVFHNSSFILSRIYIDYFRKPRMVNLSLGINSELDANVHEELITQVSKRLAAYIETRNYNQVSNENIIKE